MSISISRVEAILKDDGRYKPSSKILKQRDLYEKANNEIIQNIIDPDQQPGMDIDIRNIYQRSTRTLGSYVTLDWLHRLKILRTIDEIKKYSIDFSKKRPLNILMVAEPGSGKSHFVKCLAESLKGYNVSPVLFNMATFQAPDDLIQPIEAVRNLKVQDKLPILFIDEFDSEKKNYPALLPLLWDGEVHLGYRELKLGKLIIILAGSSRQVISTIEDARKMENRETSTEDDSKLFDVLSRINGGLIDIPPLDLKTNNSDRRADKVCMSLTLLQKRFGKDLHLVTWSLLKFIGETKFRYGVRSIALLIDLIPQDSLKDNCIQIGSLNLPLKSVSSIKNSVLAYHILPSEKDKDVSGIIERWHKISNYSTMVRFSDPQEEEDN